MTGLALTIAATALGWAVAFAVFVFALRARWIARFTNGYFVSLLIALVGVALMSASVVGVWGYAAAKHILDEELVVELATVGGIVEAQIAGQILDVEAQLTGLGNSFIVALANRAAVADLTERLDVARSFNARYLQLRLFDAAGNVIVETSAVGEVEPVNRIAVGFNLEGKPFVSDAYLSQTFKRQVLNISLPILDKAQQIKGMISARFDLQAELGALFAATKFNQSGYAVMVAGDGHVIAHPDSTRLDEDVSAYPAVQLARQTRAVGAVVALNAAKQSRLFVYRPVKNPGVLAEHPWVLLTEIETAEQLAPLRKLQRELALGIGLVLVGSLLIAHQVSVSVQGPLRTLGEFARRIGSGDLTGRVNVPGRDIAGRLGTTLNEMAAGLEERDHVKEVFGRYIATQVSDKILKGQVNLGGESRRVSILFSDIRNFTGMSEQLTPQQVVAFLNDYFSEMVDAVFEQGGILDKFMGDGLLAVFGSLGDQPDHPRRAVLAALRMKALLAKINGARAMSGLVPIAIGVGIHTDEVIVGNIGSRKRLEYTVIGDGVNTTSRLQTLNKDFGTTILISETTYEAVKDAFECRQMPEAHLRGKTRELRFYEVVSMKAGPG